MDPSSNLGCPIELFVKEKSVSRTMATLRIFYDTKSSAALPSIKEVLFEVFKIKTVAELQMDPAEVKGAYNARRGQYNASKLLNKLIRRAAKAESNEHFLALWILSDDVYVEGMNFVFGVAHAGKAAVLSAHRLESLELVNKEAIHEMGHVLGLQHCSNECVMQFSNSLEAAKSKPATLCEHCRSIITFL
jgi:archaemetzincin